MQIKIIAEASRRYERWRGIWGLSILVGENLLFDTFSSPKILERNMEKYNVDVNKIKHIVLSHDHWDHTGGLWLFLEKTRHARVYIGQSFSKETKDKLKKYAVEIIEVEKPLKITENIYSTGTLKGSPVDEQSLVVKTGRNRNILITGCAHPGLVETIEAARALGTEDIDLLLGGFHLYKKTTAEIEGIIRLLKDKYGIKKTAPFHCTGAGAVRLFKKHYRDDYIKLRPGSVIGAV